MRANLGFAFQKEGYEVVFICPYDEYSQQLKKHFAYVDIQINAKGTNPTEDLKTIYRYYQAYKELRPDVVLHYTIKPNIYGTIAASMLNIPSINNIAGLGTLFIKQNFVTKIAKWLYKFSQKRAAKIFFQNSDDKELFVLNNLVDENKTDLLPGSGVDLDKFKPLETKNDSKKFVFLMVGRVLKDKGVLELVEASKILKQKYDNFEVQLLGPVGVENRTAITKQEVEAWVKDGLVKYLGFSDNVAQYIAQADCVVLPSYREGTPRSLLEAAAMAKPLIATNVVGCKEVVDDGVNGYLCEVKNAKDLADKMEKMLNLSAEQREAMGKAGREKMVKEFDEKIVIEKYSQSIDEILK